MKYIVKNTAKIFILLMLFSTPSFAHMNDSVPKLDKCGQHKGSKFLIFRSYHTHNERAFCKCNPSHVKCKSIGESLEKGAKDTGKALDKTFKSIGDSFKSKEERDRIRKEGK